MIWLLKFLIFGHAHEWCLIETSHVRYGPPWAEGVGYRFICRCTKCGSIRKFDCF